MNMDTDKDSLRQTSASRKTSKKGEKVMSCWIGTVDERPYLERVLGEMN